MSSDTSVDASTGSARGYDLVRRDCQLCPLAATRTNVVAGEGSRRPLAMIVGEAPGPEEDRLGRPFVGRAGKILRESLRKTGWDESEVWITNTVKCFPHDLADGKRLIRAPSPAESAACRAHVEAEMSVLRPAIVIALGRTAAAAFAKEPVSLDRDHGRLLPSARNKEDVFVTFHPSGLHYRTGRKELFLEDLRKARREAEARVSKAASTHSA